MKYTHLTQDERYQIAILAKAGHDRSDIARVMERHKSTIGREMKRNRGERGYRPKQAHGFSQARMRACENGPRVAAETWVVVDLKLAETWSPERISGTLREVATSHLKVNGQPTVSHESIYQRIYADKRAGGVLHRTLRCQKARRKRYGGRERRGTIPNQVCPSICAPPSWPSVPALATGRRTWSSVLDRNRHSSRLTSARLATR